MNRQQRYNLFVSHIARQFPATPAVEGSKLYCRRHAGVLASAGFGYSTEFDFRSNWTRAMSIARVTISPIDK